MASAKLISAAALQQIIKDSSKGFDKVMNKLKIISLGAGKCSAELKVDNDHTNPMGGLHGGLSATLVDNVTTFALMSNLGVNFRHVSVDIHLSYLKGAVENDIIQIDTKVLKCGKKLAFLEAEIKNKETGDLLVKASHTKFIMPGEYISIKDENSNIK